MDQHETAITNRNECASSRLLHMEGEIRSEGASQHWSKVSANGGHVIADAATCFCCGADQLGGGGSAREKRGQNAEGEREEWEYK